MKFKDKYTSVNLKEKDKVELSNDAYAIGEMLQELVDKIWSLVNK